MLPRSPFLDRWDDEAEWLSTTCRTALHATELNCKGTLASPQHVAVTKNEQNSKLHSQKASEEVLCCHPKCEKLFCAASPHCTGL